MKYLQQMKPEWVLRLGIGLMYLYSGYDLFYNPRSWIWAVPSWFSHAITTLVPLEFYIRLQGAAEFIIGLLLLAWFSGKWGVRVAALLSSIEMAAILLFTGIDPITFRDIGVFSAALALLIIVFQKENGATRQS